MVKRALWSGIVLALATSPAASLAQTPKPAAATFITKEEVETVNKTPGIDRTLKVVDLGDEHFAVGVIHRGPIPPGGSAAPPAASAAAMATAPPCGVAEANPPSGLIAGLSHSKQTEGYYIISGEGVLVSGGHIVNGRAEAPQSEVVTTLNGPSCRGAIGGQSVDKRLVKAGDIVIIPPDVPHGWTDVKDHVDYVSFRPSADLLTPGYVHPAIRK